MWLEGLCILEFGRSDVWCLWAEVFGFLVWAVYEGVWDCIVVSVNSVVNCDSCMHIYPLWFGLVV